MGILRESETHVKRRKETPALQYLLPTDASVHQFDNVARRLVPLLAEAQMQDGSAARAVKARDEALRSLVQLIEGSDAFDLLGLVRTFIFPPNLDGHRESESDVTPAIIELIAATLVARPGGRKLRPPEPATDPMLLIAAANDALDAQMLIQKLEVYSVDHPLAQLAGRLRLTEQRVRGKQYVSVQDEVEGALLGADWLAPVMRELVGFDYIDLKAIRTAFAEQWSENRNAAFEALGSVVESEGDASIDSDSARRTKAVINAALFTPGESMVVTAEQTAKRAGLSVKTCEAVLETFAVHFDDSAAPTERALAYLAGDNPMLERNLIADGEGAYFPIGGDVGVDGLRSVVEAALKNTKYWTRYQKHRGSVSEQVAVRHLVSVLNPDQICESLKYLKPRRDVATRALGRDCAEPNAFGDEAEADALLVVDDVAFCVEVKAAAISPGARSGRVHRLATDLAKTVGEARDQAARLTNLIEVNNGLWNSKGQWLDLSGVREVRSLAVTLDDLSSLNCSLDALVRSKVIAAGKLPWVVSLHDLVVTLRVLTRPAELLLYLRRRTDSEVATRYDGADELDFVMLFVQGQLWVDPDPDEMRRRFPRAPHLPIGAQRRTYQSQAQATRVGTHTDELDAWMYYSDGLVPTPVEKPSFRMDDAVDELADALEARRSAGWLTTAADLLNGSSEQRMSTAVSIRRLLCDAEDGGRHSLFIGLPGPWGFASLTIGTAPRGDVNALSQLKLYASAKQYQLRADRCLTMLVDKRGGILETAFRGVAIPLSDDMDHLVQKVGLQPPPAGVRKPPPYARRSGRRLRGPRGKS